MKRKRLAELVREEAEALEEAPTREEKPGEAPPAQASPPGERPLPPYLTYVRKECRLRPDQLDALTALARRLNRARKGKGGEDHREYPHKVGGGPSPRALFPRKPPVELQ